MNSDGGDLRVCRETNKNINQGPVGETDDLHGFLGLWNAPGARLLFLIRSPSPTAATAMAATAIEELGLTDQAKHVCTGRLPSQLLAEVKSESKWLPFYQNGDTNLYLVLGVPCDGIIAVRFLRSASCVSASETVKEALRNIAALSPLSSNALVLKAYLIEFGKCVLLVFPPVRSERPL